MRFYKRLTSLVSILIISVFSFSGCQDVIEVEIPSEEPRLIIDAIITVDRTDPFVTLSVKVGLTSPFFGEVPVTNLKQITVLNTSIAVENLAILLETSPNSGVYEKTKGQEFFNDGDVLVFQVDYEDQLYLAETKFVSAPPIEEVSQGDRTLFSTDDTEVIVSFVDEPERDNYYVFDFGQGEFFATKDEFYKDQRFEFSYFYDRTLAIGEEIEVSMLGADQDFYNYMNLLIDQAKDDISPFDTPKATVRGNIINVTEIDNIDFFDNVDQFNNFALGYFAAIEVHKRTITIE